MKYKDMHLGSDLPRIVGLLKDLTTLKSLDISSSFPFLFFEIGLKIEQKKK